MRHPFAFSKVGRFHKSEGNTIFGWAFVSTIKGEPYFDLGDGKHSDHIPVDSILPVAKAFMRDSAIGLHQHDGAPVAEVLYAYPAIDDITHGNGMTSDKQGLIIGWDTNDEALAARAMKGEDTGFSIGGLVDAWDIVDGAGNVIDSVSLEKASRFGATLNTFGKLAGDVTKEQLRRVFRSWKLAEISLVDFPMQEPALVGVVKNRFGAKPTQMPRVLKTRRIPFGKQAVLTSIEDGHQHTVDPSCCDAQGVGRTSYDKSESDEYGHDHAFVRNADGSIEIAMNDGHTHTVEDSRVKTSSGAVVVQASRAENLPTQKGTPSVGSTQELPTMDPKDLEIASLKAQLAKSQRLGLLSDAQRAYLKTLPDTDVDGFLNKSAVDRDVEIKAFEARDPVRYTSKAGKIYRESQSELADMAKERDEAVAATATAKAAAEDAELSKSASTTMKHFTKEVTLHTKMLKALKSGLSAEDFAAATEMLAGADAVLAESFEAQGIGGSGDGEGDAPAADEAEAEPATTSTKGGASKVNEARKKLDKMASDYAKANKVHPAIAKRKLLAEDATAKQLYADAQKHDRSMRRRG